MAGNFLLRLLSEMPSIRFQNSLEKIEADRKLGMWKNLSELFTMMTSFDGVVEIASW